MRSRLAHRRIAPLDKPVHFNPILVEGRLLRRENHQLVLLPEIVSTGKLNHPIDEKQRVANEWQFHHPDKPTPKHPLGQLEALIDAEEQLIHWPGPPLRDEKSAPCGEWLSSKQNPKAQEAKYMPHDKFGLNGLEEQDQELLRQCFETGNSWETYQLWPLEEDPDDEGTGPDLEERTRLILREIQLQGALTRRFLAQELARLSPEED